MKRLPHVVILLVVVALVAADEGEKKKQGDAEKIQGKWTIVESYHKGEQRDELVGVVIRFSGKKMMVFPAGSDQKFEIAFELRPDKKLRELDMIFSLEGKVMTRKAIYELSGDTLKICTLSSGKGRPKTVGTAEDDERTLLVLKRVKSDSDDKGDDKE